MTVQRALDGPSLQNNLSVTTSTVQELRAGAEPYEFRQVITFEPSEDIYLYFGEDDTVPSTADVQNSGFTYTSESIFTVEASKRQRVYILAITATATVRFAERG